MANEYPIELPAELEAALDAFEAEPFEEVLRKGGPEVHAALVRLATTQANIPSRHRQRAIYGLGLWSDPRDIDTLVKALPKLDEIGCATAVEALGRLGTDAALEVIATLRNHRSTQVRKFVVKALAGSENSRARSALRGMAESDDSEWIRNLAAKELSNR